LFFFSSLLLLLLLLLKFLFFIFYFLFFIFYFLFFIFYFLFYFIFYFIFFITLFFAGCGVLPVEYLGSRLRRIRSVDPSSIRTQDAENKQLGFSGKEYRSRWLDLLHP